MLVYRLAKAKYAHDFSGLGASFSNNRWNSKGTCLLYTASAQSLALLEVLVHVSLELMPQSLMMLTLEVPQRFGIMVISDLPTNWNKFPYSKETQLIGDAFVKENSHEVLQVPSAIVPGEFNLLINPFSQRLKDIKLISAVDFPVDDRFFY